MIHTLKIIFALRNTYKVNTILYSLRQIPGIRNILPPELYGVRGLKIFANICAAIWEVLSAFLGKFLYFMVIWLMAARLPVAVPVPAFYLHMVFFLTIIGATGNQGLFDNSREKYYAVILLRMNAKEFTLVSWGYFLLKVIVGFTIFGTLFGSLAGIPLWVCLIIPFGAVGGKIAVAAWGLRKYERKGAIPNEPFGNGWLALAVICLAAAFIPPFLGYCIPVEAGAILMVLLAAGTSGIPVLLRFREYRAAWRMVFYNFDIQLS